MPRSICAAPRKPVVEINPAEDRLGADVEVGLRRCRFGAEAVADVLEMPLLTESYHPPSRTTPRMKARASKNTAEILISNTNRAREIRMKIIENAM